MKEVKLFINGEYRNSSENITYKSVDPSTGEEIALIHRPTEKDLNDAIDSAEKAFYSEQWRSKSPKERSEILLKISELLKERAKEFIEWEIKDSGSLIRKAKADIHNAASYFKVMSKVAVNLNLLEVDEQASRAGFSKNYRKFEPIGVCAQIIPWNFPLVMAAWKIGPVIATGCTSILKSASETPITASMLGEILNQAGLPAGVINIVTGDAKEGIHLLNSPKISKVAFTGSTQVGKEILKNSAQFVRRTTLELGGKSANIILNDADLEIAVDGALYAFLYHSGQACDSGTRLLVQADIYDTFIAKFLNRIKAIKIGPTTDPSSSLGPVINKQQADQILGYINLTKKEDAKLLYGGKQLAGAEFEKGYYIEPTVFEITPDNTIFHEEIFGPVVGITKFKTDHEAVLLANNSKFGLAGAVWSKDSERAQKIAGALEAGTVWINEYHLLNPGMPFGGYKQSGIGREMGKEGIEAYLEVKHIWESECNHRDQKPWLDAIF